MKLHRAMSDRPTNEIWSCDYCRLVVKTRHGVKGSLDLKFVGALNDVSDQSIRLQTNVQQDHCVTEVINGCPLAIEYKVVRRNKMDN